MNPRPARLLLATLTALLLTLGLFAVATPAAEAARRSSVTQHWTNRHVLYGQRVRVSGHVRPARSASGARRVVMVQYFNGRHWVRVARKHANRHGHYRIPFVPRTLGRYGYRVKVLPGRGGRGKALRWHYVWVSGQRTSLSYTVSATSVHYGDTISVSGTVTPGIAPGTTSPRAVELLRSTGTGTTVAAVARPDASGHYAFGWVGNTPGDFRYSVWVPGVRGASSAQSPWFSVSVLRDPSAVSITASASSVQAGAKVTVSGRVTGGNGGVRSVSLYRRLRLGYVRVSTRATTSAGAFSFAVPTDFFVNNRLFVNVAQTSNSSAANSADKPLTVTPTYTPAGKSSEWTRIASARMRFNPCDGTIPYRVRLGTAKAGALADVKSAIARIHQATGLSFRYVGSTSYIAGNKAHKWPSDARLVISWATDAQTSWSFSGNKLARGGPQLIQRGWRDGDGAVQRILRSAVVVDASRQGSYAAGFKNGATRGAMLMHELAHAMGLGHTSGGQEIMYPTMSAKRSGRWGRGDLNGLAHVGIAAGCLSPYGSSGTAGTGAAAIG